MGLSFRKSFKIAPGIRLNTSSKGLGISVGTKGLRYSVNSRGQRRTTISLPGTGLSYTSTSSRHKHKKNTKSSYKTAAYQRQKELEQKRKEREKLQELERNQLEVQLFENKIEMIKSIHKECDDIVDWLEIKNDAPPFNKGSKGPKELAALERLSNYKPGIFTKFLNQEEKKLNKLRNEVEKAFKEDTEDYLEWDTMIQTATRVLDGDPDAYFEVIKEFSPLDDLSEFGSGFEFFVEDPNIIEVEFDVQTKNVVPTEIKSLTQTGKLTVKNMPVSKYFDIQQDYVCSCALRIARDMFALLPVNTVYIHAKDEQLNTTIGFNERVNILSVKIDRAKLNSLNFESIDCSDSMANFEHNMIFRKTKGFAPVEMLIP